MRTAFLWSLLNLGGANIKQHIVIQTPPTTTNYVSILEQTLSHGADPYYEDRKLIRFSNDNDVLLKQEEQITTIPLLSIYNARSGVPPPHIFTKSHFLLFCHSVYATVMGYNEFCKMENKLAYIVNSYLGDEKNNWLIFMDDPLLINNIRNYGTKKPIVDQTTWITTEKSVFHDMILMDLEKNHGHL